MTKKEIVKQISDELGLTQLKVKEIVQMVFDAIVDTLIREERIELRNFGVFEVKKRAARTARNPRTGESVAVPEKYVVTFKPGKTMEERVLGLEQRKLREARQAAENGGARHNEGSNHSDVDPSVSPESPPAASGEASTPRRDGELPFG